MAKQGLDSHQPRKISRRSFLRRAGLISLATLPAAGIVVPTQTAQGLPTFVAYHDRTAADHQTQWNTLYPQGYRIISLSVYGDPASPLYAAVWVQRSGPPWVGIHNASAQQYQAFFDTWAVQGFGPSILSVTGSGSSLVFAATAEQTSGPIPLTRYNLLTGSDQDSTTIQYWNRWARENNFILRWASVYGTQQNSLYAGIWVPNTQDINWNADGLSESAATYQTRSDAQIQQWGRPAFVTLSGNQTYLSMFHDNQIGGMPGVSTTIWHRTDGTSAVVLCNGAEGCPDINAVVASIGAGAWPSNDLFPTVGIPSFSPLLVNRARGKSATQSSTAFSGDAWRAVDGNTDGMYANSSVTHTNSDVQAWWELDLGSVAQITRIDIYNRVDCCGTRLQNFYVLVSDVPFSSKDLNATRAQSGVLSKFVDPTFQNATSVAIGRTGRYVRIQLAGTDFLSLAEVQVWGP